MEQKKEANQLRPLRGTCRQCGRQMQFSHSGNIHDVYRCTKGHILKQPKQVTTYRSPQGNDAA